MAVERAGPRLFANNRDKNEVDVFDRNTLTRLATWPVTSKKNAVMALDETNHRMFVACHQGQLVVMNLDNGKELQTLPIGGGADDIPSTQIRAAFMSRAGRGKVPSMFTRRRTRTTINRWVGLPPLREPQTDDGSRNWASTPPLSRRRRERRPRSWSSL